MGDRVARHETGTSSVIPRRSTTRHRCRNGWRKAAHDTAASLAAAGTAGLYQLKLGTALAAPRSAQWFVKPSGMSYSQLFAAIEPALAPVGGSFWVRKMTLGPSPELCVLAREPAVLAPQFQMFAFQLRPIWDDSVTETTAR